MNKLKPPDFKLSLNPCLLMLPLVFLFFTSCNNQTEVAASGRTISFNEGWRFMKDTLSDAELSDYDDSGWRIIDNKFKWLYRSPKWPKR